MIQYESDERAVQRMLDALSDGQTIDHATAHTIAAGFNDGGDTANYSFVSTGAIHDGDGDYLMTSFTRGVDARTLRVNRDELSALRAYVDSRTECGDVEPVPGWSGMWVPRHVDRPHHDGALPECWCADESNDDAYEGA